MIGNDNVAKVLCLSNDESSALASLLYEVATQPEKFKTILSAEDRETLRQLYADAYWAGVRIGKD